MAVDIAFYKVIEDIAIRSGLILERYRTIDMHWILDNKDLGRVRFTSDEYIDGLKGVEKITEEQAENLIAENGYKMGYEGLVVENQEEEVNDNGENNQEEVVAENQDGEAQGNGDEEYNVDENTETTQEKPQEEQQPQEEVEASQQEENNEQQNQEEE